MIKLNKKTIILVLILIVLSSSFVSAGFWDWITGKVTKVSSSDLCEDGTPKDSCSASKPKYCKQVQCFAPPCELLLIDNCQECGCPSGSICQTDGSCEEEQKTCSDGTEVNKCSSTKPKYCTLDAKDQLTLADNCLGCGCPSIQCFTEPCPSYVCRPDGTCSLPECTKDSDCELGTCSNGSTYEKFSCSNNKCVLINYVQDPCEVTSGKYVYTQLKKAYYMDDNRKEELDMFSMAGATSLLKIGKEFSETKSYTIDINESVFSFSISADIDLKSESGIVRVILLDKKQNEYLVYEAYYPLIADEEKFTVSNICEETCVLEGVRPVLLKIQVDNADLRMDSFTFANSFDSLNSEAKSLGIQSYNKALKKKQDTYKIQRLNENIKKQGLRWVAGETSVSKMTYSEKKKLIPQSDDESIMPNLQGFEYYKGGVFEFKADSDAVLPVEEPEQYYPLEWDWRKRHGENWNTRIKDQGICGSCWAFATLGALEADINLYYNSHLDYDLSEQEGLSCTSGSCSGWFPDLFFEYIAQKGIVSEACFPYVARKIPCTKCANQEDKKVKIDRVYKWPSNESAIKESLIKNGVFTGTIPSLTHAVSFVGYNNSIWKRVEMCRPGAPWEPETRCAIYDNGARCVACDKSTEGVKACSARIIAGNESPNSVSVCEWDGQDYKWVVESECNPARNESPKNVMDPAYNLDETFRVCMGGQCVPTDFFSSCEEGETVCDYDFSYFLDVVKECNHRNGDIGYWIVKNSWGTDWGMNGYGHINSKIVEEVWPLAPFYLSDKPNQEIRCVDKDKDGYCNWGISEEMPPTCPDTCKQEKDCDDSNPNLGPFNDDFTCSLLESLPECTTDSDCQLGTCPDGSTYKKYSCSNNKCNIIYYQIDPCQSRKCGHENEFCGGVAGIRCCAGLKCQYDGDYPDASGKCIQTSKPTTSECNGCLDKENNCLPIGTAISTQYCDVDKRLKDRLSGDNSCNNNYECQTNSCLEGKCTEQKFFGKIISWFRKLFR